LVPGGTPNIVASPCVVTHAAAGLSRIDEGRIAYAVHSLDRSRLPCTVVAGC
jgi:hypothetical protein